MSPYSGTKSVRRTLRSLSNDKLEQTFIEGLEERKRGGPKDGDRARSDFLLQLVQEEIDLRIRVGMHLWDT